jgi:hypothetical protein
MHLRFYPLAPISRIQIAGFHELLMHIRPRNFLVEGFLYPQPNNYPAFSPLIPLEFSQQLSVMQLALGTLQTGLVVGNVRVCQQS